MLRPLVQGMSCLRLHGAQSGALREAVQGGGAAARALPHPLLQTVRTTFILKRKTRPYLVNTHKKVRDRRLKARHFQYVLVEDTNIKKKEPVKVLLRTSVEGLGSRGEVVEVAPNKARKELLLPGLAVYASPDNLEKFSTLITDTTQEDQPSSPFALSTANMLSMKVIYVSMNKYKPWVLEPWHIRVAFRKVGVIMPERPSPCPRTPSPARTLTSRTKNLQSRLRVEAGMGRQGVVGAEGGWSTVVGRHGGGRVSWGPAWGPKEGGVVINNKEEAAVRCRLNHYTSNMLDRLPCQGNFWELPSDPLFPEQAALLEELNSRNQQPEEEELD
ncbi:39S ribosomal protein L9, mitochondrial [Chionoecetes opilio]|uniref:Large ribosomal subunit protein bL9m n=1 Tax=Chionoecetes opilio TaxID=41210 RepID=A0A8J5CV00_CHIOP|nr:39S ribosomal protein L9, mitochondrial [Chionoecetes opilio]